MAVRFFIMVKIVKRTLPLLLALLLFACPKSNQKGQRAAITAAARTALIWLGCCCAAKLYILDY